MSANIAVLALQGDFQKHIERLQELGVHPVAARTVSEIDEADGIVIPGGESTTITKLMARYKIDDAIKNAAAMGKPIFGTCAGMIVMAKSLIAESAEKGGQTTLGLMDITVNRNAYGRQIESFETTLPASGLTLDSGQVHSLEAVFIRAPAITEIAKSVKVLASYEDAPVLVEQDNLMAASFHPEMTSDTSVHEYFVEQVLAYKSEQGQT